MFGSWKSRGRGVQQYLWQSGVEAEVEDEEADILSEVEEELSTFILRQNAWKDLQHVKDLPCWMKTASLNRQRVLLNKSLHTSGFNEADGYKMSIVDLFSKTFKIQVLSHSASAAQNQTSCSS